MAGLYAPKTRPNKPSRCRIEPSCYAPRVTRRRSSAPGPHRPSRPRSISIPSLLAPTLLALTLVLAACGGTSERASTGLSTAGSGGSVAPAPGQSASSGPLASDTVATPDAATPPAQSSPTAAGTASLALDPAADCTGTAKNRTFYGSVAAAVDWKVYCPVLPSGWFVDQGSYRLAGGGRLVIGYRGPGGAHITLSEGAWCRDGSGCVPTGTDGGATAFGDRGGSLIAADGGSVIIVVDAGSPVSWELAADGLDQTTVRMFGAALIPVGG